MPDRVLNLPRILLTILAPVVLLFILGYPGAGLLLFPILVVGAIIWFLYIYPAYADRLHRQGRRPPPRWWEVEQ